MSEFIWHPGPIHAMVALVAQRLGIPVAVILGDGRAQPTAQARQVVMYAACQLGISTVRIGRTLNRDHSSVVHGRNLVAANLATDSALATLVTEVIECGRWASPTDPIRIAHVASLREMLAEFDRASREGGTGAAAVVARSGLRRMVMAIRWTLVELGEPEVIR